MIIQQEEKVKLISSIFEKENIIISARWYGSSLYFKDSIDWDIAVMISCQKGVVDHSVYMRLRELRVYLCNLLGIDLDLIPHTEDEIRDIRSPLWIPRYNPSLFFGKDIKGQFPVTQATALTHPSLAYSDLGVIVLHENRTITRRQLLRSLKSEEGRIFIAKLAHGPANILTFLSLKAKDQYRVDPSNMEDSFRAFDSIYKVDSSGILAYIEKCKEIISEKGDLPIKKALTLATWYEHLVSSILSRNLNTLKKFLESFPYYKG